MASPRHERTVWSPSVDFSSSPTLCDFLNDSESSLKVVVGPVGSGKTRACVAEVGLHRPVLQAPNKNGARRFRVIIGRATYPQLITTTINEWCEVFPLDVFPDFRRTPPMEHNLTWPLSDGTRVELNAIFMSFESPEDENKLLSLNATCVWFNEIREIPKRVVVQAIKRSQRYPPQEDEGQTWSCVVGDTNPPYEGMWLYPYMTGEERAPGWRVYRQPAAVHEVEWAP